jgi:hypothetical protein
MFEGCRDVAHLTRLKHPGIVKLVEPYEETRAQVVTHMHSATMLKLYLICRRSLRR